MVAYMTLNRESAGSNPAEGTNNLFDYEVVLFWKMDTKSWYTHPKRRQDLLPIHDNLSIMERAIIERAEYDLLDT